MITIAIGKAKADFAELVNRAEVGEEFTIARGKKPIAILRGMSSAEPKITKLSPHSED